MFPCSLLSFRLFPCSLDTKSPRCLDFHRHIFQADSQHFNLHLFEVFLAVEKQEGELKFFKQTPAKLLPEARRIFCSVYYRKHPSFPRNSDFHAAVAFSSLREVTDAH